MNNEQRKQLIAQSWEIHSIIENRYLAHQAKKGDPQWLEKQRILLADMAIHLLQTALSPEDIDLSKLRNNIHSILTIADQFLPEADLKSATDKLFE